MNISKDVINSPKSFDISTYWLYNDIRQIIILPITLTNFIEFMNELDCGVSENSILDALNKFNDSCYSLQSSQRSKLLIFIIEKINSILYDNKHEANLKSLITLAYCIIIVAHRDQNRRKTEMNEIKEFCYSCCDILDKISFDRSSKDNIIHFYMFVSVFIKQLSSWMMCNGLKDDKLQSLSFDKSLKKRRDSTTQLLIKIHKYFSVSLEDMSVTFRRPMHHLLILGFYSFISMDCIEQEFTNEKMATKRRASFESDEPSAKLTKLTEDDVTKPELKEKYLYQINKQLLKLTSDVFEKKTVCEVELIEFLKKTPEIFLMSKKEHKHEIFEQIFVNLIKLWIFAIKKKVIAQFEYNLYYWPLVSTDIKIGDFKLQIKTLLAFIMELQSKLIHDILSNPSWVLDLLVSSIELIIIHSTNDNNLSDAERKECANLMGEVGKVLEVLLQPKNLKELCRVVVVIPHRLFTLISELKYPLYPEVRKTLSKNIVCPIIAVLNKHTLGYLKMELKGAAREVCRDFLQIK